MTKVQRHRGPDDSGINLISFERRVSRPCDTQQPASAEGHFTGVVGFNRLSILDLSRNGHQPMTDDSGRVTLLFNGEIYNAFEYRAQLEEKGYRFKSTTDTEVILALYLAHGFDRTVRMLNGMFAIALIDLAQGTWYLARDRFGIKPLYVFEGAERIAFSSEIKSFSFLPDFRWELNHQAVDEYLLFRNTLDTALIRGVDQVKPGTYRVFSGGVAREVRYHDFNSHERAERHDDFDASKARLGEALEASTVGQLISDVKLGCQLSGGVDSSLVTYYAYRNCREQLESVSILLEDQAFSEVEYVNRVASTIPIMSHRFVLDDQYFVESFDSALWHFEFPIGHPNSIGIYLLAQRARDHVTVLLSGEGADELLGGYPRFGAGPEVFYLRGFLTGLRDNLRHPFHYMAQYARGMNVAAHCILGGGFMDPEMAGNFKRDFSFRGATRSRRRLFGSLRGSLFDKRIKYELMTYLPDLLLRQDKMTMAHSIENRVPFLDNTMLEAAFAIPEGHLLRPRGGRLDTKSALKSLASDYFGEAFAYSPKRGFSIPLRSFFKSPRFNELIRDQVLRDIDADGLFDGGAVRQMVDHLDSLRPPQTEALWIIISFQMWKRKFNVA